MNLETRCAVTINGTEYTFAAILARHGSLTKRGEFWFLQFPHEAERAVMLDLTLAEHIRRAHESRPRRVRWTPPLDSRTKALRPYQTAALQAIREAMAPWDCSPPRPVFPRERCIVEA